MGYGIPCRRPGSAPDGQHASMSGLNEPLALPQSSHALTEMPPMEALYAAFAGAAGEPQHDLTLDPAAMDIHDGDEVSIAASSWAHTLRCTCKIRIWRTARQCAYVIS